MTKTTAQFAAFALAALMTLGTVAGMNGIASKQYAAAERVAQAGTTTQVAALQHPAAHRAA